MLFRSKKNRRRVDLAKKTKALKAAARSHSGTALKLFVGASVLAAASFGVSEAWAWAQTAPRFALATVRVTGNQRAKSDELTRLSGLALGQNLFRLDPAALERALAAHPWVKSVSVRRDFPSAVEVRLVEHQAVAVVSLQDLYLLNADGEPFKRLQPGENLDLPLLTGLERDEYVAHPAESREKLKLALATAVSYLQSPASKDHPLSEAALTKEGGVTLVTTAGQEIHLGEGALDDKLARLQRLRGELKSRSLSAAVIRLDNRTRPDWVTVQLSTATPERGARPGK